MSSRESPSPLTKLKDGVKKTHKKLEEDIIKTTKGITKTTEKIKLVRRGDAASERSPLKQRFKKTAVRAMNSKNSWEDGDVTSSSPANLATQTSGDVNYASLESDVDSSSNNINTIYEDNDEEEASSAANDQPLSTTNDTASSSVTLVQLLFITIISVSTVFHTWLYRLDIISNQIPFIVAIHWALIAYFIGSSSSLSEKIVVLSIDDIALDEEDTTNLTNQDESNDHRLVTFTKEEEEKAEAKTKQLIRRIPMGRRHYSKIKAAYLIRKESKESSPIEGFFTNLKPVGFITTKNSPISEGMMNRLLKYSPDFGRRKSAVGEIDMATMLESCLQVQDQLSKEELEEEEKEEREANYEMGTAPLVNLKASKLERDFDYVEPLCKFRGMDMFVGDFPEKEIWKQPMLLKNGLRDTATVIGNMMLPTGNLVSYLQMPDWFDDWDNIPEETEDDPPDIKAFKRFFTGDLEYQRRRAKIIPMVVKAPYVVKMIAPNPSEMTMHTPRHPVSVKKVNKVVDPATGETTAAAVMELGVDFYTSAAIGRIINVVMPHLGKITVDVAMVIHPPWEAEGEEVNEPSACIGVWRIDQVDFLSCAQLPEKPIEMVEEEIKDIMKSLAMESGSPGD